MNMSITNNKVYIVMRYGFDGDEYFYGVFSSLEKAQNYINMFNSNYTYEFEIREEELDDPDI